MRKKGTYKGERVTPIDDATKARILTAQQRLGETIVVFTIVEAHQRHCARQ